VVPGPFTGLQVLLPGETAQGGTPIGKVGPPSDQTAGTPFNLTVRAVDDYWNLVGGVNDRISLGSSDAFAGMPAETLLANGQVLLPVTLFKAGSERIWAADVDQPLIRPDTSSFVNVIGGSFARVLILAPGEVPAPGTESGRTGSATDQSINFAFTVTVLATDQWWNPVGGVADVVQVTSNDPLAELPPGQALVDGRAEMTIRLSTGGFQQISVTDVTNPLIQGSSTQVRAISSGFHLEASITPSAVGAGETFSLNVRVTNDAGSVIQEINSFVTLQVQNANTGDPGRGALLTTQFQLLQGQRTVSQTYTFAEPIVITASDDAGNAPAVSNTITIGPGQPEAIQLTSDPPWVGGNKHATVSARLVDAFDNGVPDQEMIFTLLSGTGTMTPIDSLTDAGGTARIDFLSPRLQEIDRIRASSNGIISEFDLEVAFVDPAAAGGHISNYPNPFHPGVQPTTIAYVLSDDANVRMRIYTLGGDRVLERNFARGGPGGFAGLNEIPWDGRNGKGNIVASGGYIVLVEAQGQGETLHVMRRKIAAVR
jgi:predicted RNA-binding protein with TRAM domain